MNAKRKNGELRIESFNFYPGRLLLRKYEVVSRLGAGWEGEVFKVREKGTEIERAAKFFFPQRNPKNRASMFYARKLHKLHHCPILIQYHTQETISYRGVPVTFLVSDFVDGELLSQFQLRQPGKRLSTFEALHLLHSIASGIECIHQQGDYHGDLHSDNIIVKRYGLGFDVKLLDMFHWGAPTAANIRHDVCELVRIFYDALGGARYYSRQPPAVKQICCGLKRTLITRKFRTAGDLREHLETIEWEQ